jgi:hypothetical protein
MADTFTANLALTKIEVGASSDTWGAKLNLNFDSLDALFGVGGTLLVSKGGTNATTAAGARANLGLGTGDSPTFTAVNSSGAAGTLRVYRAQTAGVLRWQWGAEASPESGGNVGSDWDVYRYSDGGLYLGRPLQIKRDTGIVQIESGLRATSNLRPPTNSISASGAPRRAASPETPPSRAPTPAARSSTATGG